VTEAVKRGLAADFVAPRVSFFWDIQNDFFEEICKLAVFGRLWARMMRDWVGAKDPPGLADLFEEIVLNIPEKRDPWGHEIGGQAALDGPPSRSNAHRASVTPTPGPRSSPRRGCDSPTR